MKQTLKRRICAAILCHILLLGLAGCGKANKAKPNDGGDPPVKASVDALKQGQPAADSEETVDGAESLARVRGDLEYDGRLTGAAAYLGLREKGDQTELTDWLRENCADLTSELPFLLEIPSERVLGAGYGKLFCIVPRDENTSLAVNHVTWQMMGNGLHPVADEVLYREEYAEPVLVFVDPEEPDKEVNLVTNDGVVLCWYPQEDGYGNLFLPTDEAGAPMLYDFAIYGLRGTLKSHLTRTFLPFTLISSTDFLFSICGASLIIFFNCYNAKKVRSKSDRTLRWSLFLYTY